MWASPWRVRGGVCLLGRGLECGRLLQVLRAVLVPGCSGASSRPPIRCRLPADPLPPAWPRAAGATDAARGAADIVLTQVGF